MYYSNGNYEAFADPKKPEGVDNKSAYIIGSGLAGLSAAVFLVRDAQMKGENIHVLEELPVAGGSLDGAKRPIKLASFNNSSTQVFLILRIPVLRANFSRSGMS